MKASDKRGDDPFRPPDIPIEVGCLHCGQTYDSYLIEFRPDPSNPYGGDWCCPTPGCGGVGFCFDIFPTDPDWTDENGEKICFFDEDDDDDDDEWDEEFPDGEGIEADSFPGLTPEQFDDIWEDTGGERNPRPPKRRDSEDINEDDIPF